jgi:hypothetical protein
MVEWPLLCLHMDNGEVAMLCLHMDNGRVAIPLSPYGQWWGGHCSVSIWTMVEWPLLCLHRRQQRLPLSSVTKQRKKKGMKM